MSKQRLASYPLFEYNPNLAFVDFYESITPGDTVFRLSIRYDGYEDHLLSCLQSPLFRHVQELSISGAFDELPLSIAHLKQLKALFIYNHQNGSCGRACPLYIPNEIYHLPELEVLSLYTNNLSITDSIVNLKKLKHLYLSPVSLLPCLFTDMPQLRSIALNMNIFYEAKNINVCGKLLMFNSNAYHSADSWHYDEIPGDTVVAISSVKNEPLNEKIDIKLNYASDKKRAVFSLNGEVKNNEPTGPWTVTCDYSLLANYNHRKSDVIKVMNDTMLLATITRNTKGEEFQEFRNVKKHFRNGIPYGNWEYYQYNGVCYKQIVYDDPEQPNSMNAITTGYFVRKTYVNGKAYGRWTESTGDHIKTTEFENGKPVKITDQKRTYAIPSMIKEFKYDQTRSNIDTYYPNAFHKSYLYSKESYNNYIPDGEFMSYYPNGTIHEKKAYSDGKITGDVIGNHENGKTAYVKSYEQGLIKHERRFHQNGIMAQEAHYNVKGRHGTENTWSEKGKLKESTYYENGLPFGVSQKFDDSGRVISEKYYEQGLKVYDEEQGFDHIFVTSEKNKLVSFFYLFKMEQTCCRNTNCVQEKKVINDSIFKITEYQYTENRGRHLKYIKEFSFKNYRLSGTQVLKDSADNVIQYVHCKSGLKDGKFTLVYRNDSLSMNYKRNLVIDTVLTYYIKRGRLTEIHYYKNRQLYKAEQFYFSHTGKPIDNIVVEYVKAKQPIPATKNDFIDEPLGLIMGLPKHPNSMFFIPETLTQYVDGKKISTVKFHAKVTEADCMNIRRVKGYAIADGKKERFIKEDERKYEYWFKIHSVFNIFFNGMVTCYH